MKGEEWKAEVGRERVELSKILSKCSKRVEIVLSRVKNKKVRATVI